MQKTKFSVPEQLEIILKSQKNDTTKSLGYSDFTFTNKNMLLKKIICKNTCIYVNKIKPVLANFFCKKGRQNILGHNVSIATTMLCILVRKQSFYIFLISCSPWNKHLYSMRNNIMDSLKRKKILPFL